MKNKLSFIRLYFDAWIHPLKVIQTILKNDPIFGVWPMLVCVSIINALNPIENHIWSNFFPIPFATYTEPLITVVSSIFVFVLTTWLIYWIGKRIGGNGSYRDIRAAFAWGMFPPTIVGAILSFIPGFPSFFAQLFFLWGLILVCINVSQTHKISIMKTISIFLILLVLSILIGVGIFSPRANKEIENRAHTAYERGEVHFAINHYKEAMWDYEEVSEFYSKPHSQWVDLALEKEWICRAYLNDWTPPEGPMDSDVRQLHPDLYTKYK